MNALLIFDRLFFIRSSSPNTKVDTYFVISLLNPVMDGVKNEDQSKPGLTRSEKKF